MIKSDIINVLIKNHALTIREATAVLKTTLDEIISGLMKDESVELRNFGIFKTKKQKPRTIIHPETGKPIKRPAKTVVLFETSSTVKAALNKPKKVKAKNPKNVIVEEALKRYEEGKFIDLQKFIKKYKIKLPK